jgi:isoleucyl-tRNA synthetase
MKNYIENIRKSVKKLGYIPTSEQIRNAINKVCSDGDDILANKAAIVDEVISYFQSPETIDLANINQSEIEADMPQELSTNIPDSIQSEANSEEDLELADESNIIISSEDKQDLIASQSLALGIELSEGEVQELATDIKDNFIDYETFVDDAINAIVNYAEHRSNRLEQKIRDARKQIEGNRQQLNRTLVGEFRELNNFFRQGAAKRQELSRQIAEAFKT